MRQQPKDLRSMETAPRDGTPIDLWSPNGGWVRDTWWDKDVVDDDDYPDAEDGWVTLGPRPFVGWRPIREMRERRSAKARRAPPLNEGKGEA